MNHSSQTVSYSGTPGLSVNQQISSLLAVANSQIGEHYDIRNDTKYGLWYGDPAGDYCDMFVSWCAAQIGLSDAVGKFAYVPDHVLWFKSQGRFDQTPRPGSIIFYDFVEGLAGQGSHVGLLVSYSGNSVSTIEGNTVNPSTGSSGYVARRTRPLVDIIGYGHPNYQPGEKQMLGNTLAAGESTVMSWPQGTFKQISFFDDNTLTGQPQGSVRVALYSHSAGWQIATVSASDGPLLFAHNDVYGVSLRREDTGTQDVSVCVA